MLKSFTRNYSDNSTEAGFQFTFFCDICQDGYRSSFIESSTYKKHKGLRGVLQSQRQHLFFGFTLSYVSPPRNVPKRSPHIRSEIFLKKF